MKVPRLRQEPGIFFYLGVFVLILSACAGLGKRLEEPRITLANIAVRDINLIETVFQVDLRVYNTNDAPLEVTGLDCEIELNDRHFATGVSNSKVKIASYETATIPIVAYSSVLDLVKSVQGLQNKEKLKYRIAGRIRLGGGFFVSPVIPFESDGEVSAN